MRSLRLAFLGLCFFVLFIASPLNGLAQPANTAGDPDAVPIGGIEILVGLGSLLGLKRLSDKRKKKQN